MAPLSFLKSDKDKDKDKSVVTPDSVSPSKYHPSRLLRRKSTKSVVLDTDAVSIGTSSGPPTGSTSWTFVEPQPQEMESPGYERFGRGGSEPGSNSKRSGGLYERAGEDGGVVVIDAGIPGMSRRIADQQTFFNTIETPVRSQSPPMYPTALSPPRRPLPRSPRAQQTNWNPTSPGSDMLQRFSSADTLPTTTGSTTGSSEWLKRKPSGGRLRNDPHSARASPLPRKPLQGAAHIRHTSFSSMEPDAETSSAESDGEVGIGRPARRRPQVRGDGSAYEVEVLCVDDRVASDEMKWEVTIRRRDQKTGLNGSFTSPLQVSTASSTAQAPSSAGSINLSLSLDQPTGKLVFIAFPMDIHATPTRRRRPSAATSTPPPPSTTPPPAPNLAASSPTTPSSHRKGATSMWPSPRENGVGGGHVRSPSSSPRDVFTPRRSRIVSASQLEGGLYGKPSPDGMSEDLETGLSITEAVAMRGQIERN